MKSLSSMEESLVRHPNTSTKSKNKAAKLTQPIKIREVKAEVSKLGNFSGHLETAKPAINNIYKNG